MRRARAALALAALLLTGCAPTPEVARAPAQSESSAGQRSLAPSPTGDLLAQRVAAGIPDCPNSDPDVPAVAGGLPDIELACLGGGRTVRLAGLRGRPMIINVWAQWCGPCRTEAPYLAEVGRTRSRSLVVLGIDYADPRPDYAIEFARAAGWGYPQVADPDLALRGPMQIAGPPQTFFVRPDGVIAYRHTGPFGSTAEIAHLARRELGVEL